MRISLVEKRGLVKGEMMLFDRSFQLKYYTSYISFLIIFLLLGCGKRDLEINSSDSGSKEPPVAVATRQVTKPKQAQKVEVVENKAGVLEQKASAEGSKALPSPSEIITKTEAQAIDPVGDEPLSDAITCFARTIYWEARGEGAAGMEAIANVVMNRLGHEGFPNTICEVVRQGSERGACQFSWWCDGRSDNAEEGKPYAIAKEIARKALNRQLTDRTGGALYFHQRESIPSWSAEYVKTVEIGEFVFYKPHGGTAK